MLGLFIKVSNHSDQSRTVTIQKRVRRRMPVARGRILEPPPDRGSVRRTSRSKCGCPESLSCPKTPGLAVPLRLVLRTQPAPFPRAFGGGSEMRPTGGEDSNLDCDNATP